MSFEDYHWLFRYTYIHYDTSDLFRDDWLILDDETDSPGKDRCGKTCTRHEFTLTSSIDQKVLVAGSTWQWSSYPLSCYPDDEPELLYTYDHFVGVEGVDGLITIQ